MLCVSEESSDLRPGSVLGSSRWHSTAGPAGGDERPVYGEFVLSSVRMFIYRIVLMCEVLNAVIDINSLILCRNGKRVTVCFSREETSRLL